jgi:hypothetical protein
LLFVGIVLKGSIKQKEEADEAKKNSRLRLAFAASVGAVGIFPHDYNGASYSNHETISY